MYHAGCAESAEQTVIGIYAQTIISTNATLGIRKCGVIRERAERAPVRSWLATFRTTGRKVALLLIAAIFVEASVVFGTPLQAQESARLRRASCSN